MQTISNNQFSPDKVYFHQERLIKILKGGITFPSVYEISPVGYCNQKCIYCVSQDFRSKDRLTKTQAFSIFKQIKELDGRAVTITGGGEPLLHPEIDQVIEFAKSLQLSVGIITNGTYTSKDLDKTIAKHASFCRFSFDTIDPSVYKQIRGTNHIDLALNNVRNLVNQKRKHKTEILIGVQMVWVNQSFSEIESMARFFGDIEVDFFQIRPVDNVPSLAKTPNLDIPEGANDFLRYLEAKYSQPRYKVIPSSGKWAEVFNNNIGKSYTGCVGGNLTTSIGHDNKVYFCCSHIGNPVFSLGDLSQQSLKEILLSSKRKELINNVDHRLCQNQCRNHEINKKLAAVATVGFENTVSLINSIDQTKKPVHWEFL